MLISLSLTLGQTATLSVPALGAGLPAGSVFFPVTVEAIDDGVATLQFYFEFNETALTPLNVTYPSTNFPFYEWMNNLNYAPGEIILTWMSLMGMNVFPAPGEIFCIIEFYYTGYPNYSYFVWGTNKGVHSYPEKGMTAMWTETLAQFSLTLIDGGTPIPQNIWTGAIDDDWFNPGNWDLGSIPSAGDDVHISDMSTAPFPVIYFPGALTVSLTIHPNASLTIAPGGDLTTNGLFTNEGVFIINSGKSGSCGSLINLNASSIFGNGTFTFKKNTDINGLTGNINSWHNLSSPLDGFNTEDILDYYVNRWDESLDELEILSTGDSCNPVSPPAFINPMEGWSIKLNQNFPDTCPGSSTGTIIEFSGPVTDLHAGSYSIPFTANTSGYNLLGNPYPSYVDPGLIPWPANLEQAIYFKNGWSDSYWSWAGGIGPNIPPAQGFFVKATGEGVLTFTGNERVHDSISTKELGPGEKLLAFKVSNHENHLFDLTYIRFKEGSTPGFDSKWDAYKLFAESPGVPQLYTKAAEDDLSINCSPELSAIPLYFACGQSGTFSIEAIETSDFVYVLLGDLFTGTFTDLLVDSYTFDFTTGDDPDRFIIHFTPVGFHEYEVSNIKKIWSNEHNIYVNIMNSDNGYILVYNIIGQEIARKNIEPGLNVIPVHEVNTFYLVRVVTSADAVSAKVYIR